MQKSNSPSKLPIPDFYQPEQVARVWRVPYQQRAEAAEQWVKKHEIPLAQSDAVRSCLMLIDVQNTFCLPEFELFVGGRSGRGAIEDNQRLCEFIYHNLTWITEIAVTMDTHQALQIFHPVFWVDAGGHHPQPHTQIRGEELLAGRWRVNGAIASSLFPQQPERLSDFALHYVRHLDQVGKYPLTIWPYHSLLGGIGHSLVSAVEESVFFHNLVRGSQTRFELKGNHPLTENYSVFRPEVGQDGQGEAICPANKAFFDYIVGFDRILIAGQAKSHCVAWTVADLLAEIQVRDPAIAHRVYLLEDCMSPVVVPGVVDFTDAAEASFAQFAQAGMHRVDSRTLTAEL